MKIAVFSDIHGNYHALEAILDDAHKQGVDLVVCAGDAVNPLPDSLRVWRMISELNIPMVRGNHEEYMIAMDDPDDRAEIQGKVQYLPAQVIAHALPDDIITAMADLPLTRSIPGPAGGDVLICHASPHHTRRSFSNQMDDEMVASLSRRSERVIVGGHIHQPWRRRWRDKLLLLCGGGGLPLNGSATAQYLILWHRRGVWLAEHRAVDYDHAALLRRVRHSGFLVNGGPMAWLFYDELWTAERRIVPFLHSIGAETVLITLSDWQQAVQRYLEAIGRWTYLAPLVYLAPEKP